MYQYHFFTSDTDTAALAICQYRYQYDIYFIFELILIRKYMEALCSISHLKTSHSNGEQILLQYVVHNNS